MQVETSPRRPVKIAPNRWEYVRADGTKTYFADYKLDGRQHREKLAASNRTEAKSAHADLIARLGRGEVALPTKLTVQDVGEQWLATLRAKPRTLEAYRYHLKHNITPKLGNRKAQAVTPQAVAELVAWLRDERKVSAATQAGALRTLSALMAHCVWQRLIPSNPVALLPKTKRPKALREPHRYLSSDERKVLLAACSDSIKPVVEPALWTGARESELLGLTWSDVDLKANAITFSAQLSRGTKDRPAVRVPTKTDVTRVVDLDPETVVSLKAQKEDAFGKGFAKPTDYVFCTLPDGLPVHHRNLGKAFAKAATKAKLNIDGRRKLRFHDLRRTHASVLLESGASPSYVAERLGHTVAVLYAEYAGLIENKGQAEKALSAIQAARH